MAFNIIIVDDSEIIRAVLKRTLEMTKIPLENIFEADNGSSALTILEDNWVDIIFTDINMPEMNGLEFIDNLRKSEDLKDIPVVVISTEGSAARISELKEKGIIDYLRKPFSPENIRDVVTNSLGDWNE